MHIVNVKLENIKSHKNSNFDFECGTTAITGENGAGKTTIIEAVAWALFDLLDYKKDDFVRRGAKKGTVQVTFESGLDERKYTVNRDTGTGYSIFDPELGTRIRDKKEDVTGFLRQHLGVEPGTDLELLFRSAIGVPQGTFTAIFLDTAVRRKEAFDKLLKVDEYRLSADKLLATARYVENQTNEVEKKIARAEGELARFELVENEHKNTVEQTAALSSVLVKLQQDAAGKRSEVGSFDAEEAALDEIRAALDKLKAEFATTEILLAQKQTEANAARLAAGKLKAVEKDYQIYLAAMAGLKNLEEQRAAREQILNELNKAETAVIRAEAEQKNLRSSLEKAESAAREAAELKPQILQQKDLEERREVLRNGQAQAKAFSGQVLALEEKLKTLRAGFGKTAAELAEAEEKSRTAAEAEALGKRETELTRRLASLQTRLESDEKFQSEIKNGLCPILSEKCLNLKEGQTLEAFVSSQFGEIRAEIALIENEHRNISGSLKTAREAGQFLRALDTLRRRQKEIEAEGLKLKEEKAAAEKHAENLPKIETELLAVEKLLGELKNPRERAEALRREAKNAPAIKENIAENEKQLGAHAEQKNALAGKLEKFAALDADWAKFSTERDRTAAAHREYVANELLAKALPEREAELEKITAESEKLKKETENAGLQFAAAATNYQAEKHQTAKAELFSLEKDLAETNTRLSITQKRQGELEKELERLREIRISMQSEFKEKERLEKIGEATKFIRDTLKEAAPRVARNYVYHVSNEANQLFREITGNPERSLKWKEDYAVMLEEGGYERPFQNLSGGEQMAAAISIRLALLKQLSDVRLAFFDEPTTNMDAERRQNLAEQISHITEKRTFDQLFVITHDDTFEEYVDNVITVGPEANEIRETLF
jgi:exonuclease SbcC